MTRLFRSDRSTSFSLKRTPSTVAPGTYTGQSQFYIAPSRVPFSTTSSRHDVTKGKAGLPGPGNYNPTTTSTQGGSKGIVLGTSGPRIQPHEVSPAPGPGQYAVASEWERIATQEKKKREVQQKVNVFYSASLTGREGTPVAIPIPGHHCGYHVDESTGKLTLHQNPVRRHAGNHADSVGPGTYYNPDASSFASTHVRSTSFGLSNTQRDPFQLKQSAALRSPGPGAYQPSSSPLMESGDWPTEWSNKEKRIHAKTVAMNRGTSSFASRVPMVHEIKAKEKYEPRRNDVSMKSTTLRLEHEGVVEEERGTSETRAMTAPGRSRAKEKKQATTHVGFGSTAARPDISSMRGSGRSANVGLTPQACVSHTPGPGAYMQTEKTCWLTMQVRNKQNRENKKQVGFSSSAKRGVSEPTTRPSKTEEPAQMDNFMQRPSTAAGDLLQPPASSALALTKTQDRPRTVFGSSQIRRTYFQQCVNDKQYLPGPGEYNPIVTEQDKQAHAEDQMQAWQREADDAILTQLEMQLSPEVAFSMDSPTVRLKPKLQPKKKKNQTSASSMFQSTTKRFPDPVSADTAGPRRSPPQVIMERPVRSEDSSVPVEQQACRQMIPEKAQKNVGFGSTSQRFVGAGSVFGSAQALECVPGPGQYSSDPLTLQKKMHREAKAGSDERFKTSLKPCTGSIGPGSYDVSGSMVKKSYNVTMTSATFGSFPIC